MKRNTWEICPYCQEDIKEANNEVVCLHCQIPHHKACWDKNNGCTTFACPGKLDVVKQVKIPIKYHKQDVEPLPSKENVTCGFCGAAMKAGHEFCSKCGQKQVESRNLMDEKVNIRHAQSKQTVNVCRGCGAVVQPNHAFCGKCGMKHELHNGAMEANSFQYKKLSICQGCGSNMLDHHVFCAKCGTRR